MHYLRTRHQTRVATILHREQINLRLPGESECEQRARRCGKFGQDVQQGTCFYIRCIERQDYCIREKSARTHIKSADIAIFLVATYLPQSYVCPKFHKSAVLFFLIFSLISIQPVQFLSTQPLFYSTVLLLLNIPMFHLHGCIHIAFIATGLSHFNSHSSQTNATSPKPYLSLNCCHATPGVSFCFKSVLF